MNDFLNRSDAMRKSKAKYCDVESFDRVFSAQSALQQVHSKSQMDIRNLEDVFAAFEIATMLESLPGFDAKELPILVPSMKRLIVDTIDENFRFDVNKHRAIAPHPYDLMIEKLLHIQKHLVPSPEITFMTFNYDLALDFTLHQHGLNFSYGFDDAAAGEMYLLKLHGSLNWGRCNSCRSIEPWHLVQLLRSAYKTDVNSHGTGRGWLIPGQLLGNVPCKCGANLEPEPVVVPPTWSKAEYHKDIQKVWTRAAEQLRAAEHIVVIGYSLPETDQFFRFLYGIGTLGGNPLKSFKVYNPDAQAEERFLALLGPGTRDVFKFRPLKFFDACKHLVADFNL